MLECLGGARCGMRGEEVYWPAYIRKCRVVSGCIKVLQCVGAC